MLQVASGVAAEFAAATFTVPGFPPQQVTTEHCPVPVWALVSSVQSPDTLPDIKTGAEGRGVQQYLHCIYIISCPDIFIHI